MLDGSYITTEWGNDKIPELDCLVKDILGKVAKFVNLQNYFYFLYFEIYILQCKYQSDHRG